MLTGRRRVLLFFLSVTENLDPGYPTVRWFFAIRSVVREQVCGDIVGFHAAVYLPVDTIELAQLQVCTRRVHYRPRVWLDVLSIYCLVFLVCADIRPVGRILRYSASHRSTGQYDRMRAEVGA